MKIQFSEEIVGQMRLRGVSCKCRLKQCMQHERVKQVEEWSAMKSKRDAGKDNFIIRSGKVPLDLNLSTRIYICAFVETTTHHGPVAGPCYTLHQMVTPLPHVSAKSTTEMLNWCSFVVL